MLTKGNLDNLVTIFPAHVSSSHVNMPTLTIESFVRSCAQLKRILTHHNNNNIGDQNISDTRVYEKKESIVWLGQDTGKLLDLLIDSCNSFSLK